MKQQIILQLNNLSKKFADSKVAVVDSISLTLQQGELLGLLGPSGCGKTTLLRIIAGFENIDCGMVSLGGNTVSSDTYSLPPEKRNTGMVFQDYALFPHLTVAENISFGLKQQQSEKVQKLFNFTSRDRSKIKARVAQVLELVGLAGLENRYPHQLSGGQQQRISLARALAPQPELILLDEPLSNLDVQVRHRLREEIRAILKASGTSAVFVTHDKEEALAISDKIAVMRQGKIEQIGTPEEVYTQPASRFVAEFVTQANFLPAQRRGKVWQTEICEVETASVGISANCDRADLMLRQEDIALVTDATSQIVVRERQFLGREYHYCLETASGKRLHARTNLGNAIPVGTNVRLSLRMASPQIFPLATFSNDQVIPATVCA